MLFHFKEIICQFYKKNKSAGKISLIIIAVAVFGAGILIGVIVAKPRGGPAINPLSSKVVLSVYAFGKLTSVSKENIVITSGEDSLTIATNQNTKIVSYEPPKGATENTPAVPKNITLPDLKIGDYLNVNLKVLPSGILNAVYIHRVQR